VSDEAKKKGALGSIISVFSASGGCGATTIVLNLANELRLKLSRPVMVVDLDCYYGTAATYLGISGRYGIADVLSHKGPIDETLIKSSACNYTEDFDVLISPAGVEHPGPKSLRYHNLIDVLLACKKAYRYTIIDAPRASESVAADLATVSKVVLIVFQLTVKDIKSAQSMVSFLSNCGVERKKILPLANRFEKRGPLVRFEDGEKALGLGIIPRIRSDFRNVLNSLNLGQPLAQTAPWSGLRCDFQKLVTQIYSCETDGDSGTDI
jgi:pilus assembly protein CpaE